MVSPDLLNCNKSGFFFIIVIYGKYIKIEIDMGIDERFTKPVVIAMQREIEQADGNEVFFVGNTNAQGLVTSVKAYARGGKHSVPVNMQESTEPCVLIHNHPGGNLTPSEADLAAASRANENSQGFYIINNSVTKVYVVMEPVILKPLEPLDANETAFYISDGGSLSKISQNFEERPVQISLLKRITESFNENSISAFEAGTGVGKSFSYLIPSMLWAVKNNQRVVISTGTINLQQQLAEKDIPAAEKIIGTKVKSILLKGRQNYVCLRRLDDCAGERDLFALETEVLDKIIEWVKVSRTGSRSDLAFNPPENIWSRIKSESDACMGMRCPYRDKCFVMSVRREASDAKILVVNHHLLFADIESRMNGVGYDDAAVLPPYKRIVFDEAHGIESAATSFFSETVNRFKIIKQMNLLYRQRKNSFAGYVFTLMALSSGPDRSFEVAESVSQIKNDILNLEMAAIDLMETENTLRLHKVTSQSFSPVLSLLMTLSSDLMKLVSMIREIMEEIEDDDKTENAYWESKSILRHLESAAILCKDFSAWDEKQDKVFWIQKQRLPPEMASSDNPVYVVFTQTPLDISHLMNGGVFEPMESVVCTSATLQINKDFNFWMRRTGLSFVEEKRLQSSSFPSPFDYKKNVILAVPDDIPFPDSVDFQTYVEDSIRKLVKASCGRTLVLFTSYESLKHAFTALKNFFLDSGITLLKQGDDDRFRLLDNFKNDTDSVLFATDSFWQGIDVPGDSLSQVIIVKLPFSVPSDPVFAARAEAVDARGGSSFMELSLPEAVIKFRQGFGRLVRRGDDRGVVVVLDRRIIEKRYGRLFIDSIPETKVMYCHLCEIADTVKSFL